MAIIFLALVAVLVISWPAFSQSEKGEKQLYFLGHTDWWPYHFLDEAGQPDGFSVDLAKRLSARLGFQCQIRLLEDWAQAQAEVAQGRADALLGLTRTPEREKLFDFSKEVLTIKAVIAVRNETAGVHSLEELKGALVGVVKGTPYESYLKEFPGLTLALVQGEAEGIGRLSTGEIFAFVSPEISIRYAVQTGRYKGIKIVGEPLWQLPYAIAVPKGRSDLLAEINAGLEALEKQGVIEELKTKWFGQALEPHHIPAWLKWALIGLGIAIILAVAFYLQAARYSHRLEREVQARTAELSRLNRILHILSDCNQAVVRANDEEELLKKICRIIAERGGYPLAWVGYAQPDQAKTIKPVAWAGKDSDYLEGIRISWADDEFGRGPTGKAIRSGQPHFVPEIAAEPDFYYRQQALQRGFRSVVVLPVIYEGQTLGTLNIYSTQPSAFEERELELLKELAADLAFGVTTIRLRAERQQALEALRESQNFLRLIIDSVPGLVAYVDAGERLQMANKEYLTWLGLSPEEVIGRHIQEIMGPVRYSQARPYIAQALSGKPAEWEGEMTLADQRRVNFLAKYVPDLAEDGKVKGYFALVIDITERKKAEEALRERNRFIQAIMDNLPIGLAVNTVSDGKFIYMNRKFEEFYGWPKEALPDVETFFLKVYPDPEFRREISERILADIRSGDPKRMIWEDVPITRSSGEKAYVTGINIPMTEENLMISTVIDVTERKKALEALRESQEFIRLVMDSVPGLIAYVDADERLQMANKEFLNWHGWELKDVLGRSLAELHGPQRYAQLRPKIAQVLSGKPAEWEGEGVCPDGRRIDYLAKYFPDLAENGRVKGFVSLVVDITALKRAESSLREMEARLFQAQKLEAIGTLAGGIAHDFNNILAAIMGYTELALADSPEEAASRRHLEQVLKASQRAKNLVQQILSFSRKAKEELRPIRLASVVKEALKLLRATLPATIEIKEAVAEPEAAVVADPTQIHQVLMNLCANAAYAMREKGGVLEVTLEEMELNKEAAARFYGLAPGRYQCLSVRDTGTGMDKETMARIFDPFFTTKGPGEGSGMGLAVVHGIVQRHGGAIGVESEPGQGSLFRVYLPVIETLRSEQIQEVGEALPLGKGERVLLVDDEAALLEIGQQTLERLGYKVTTARSGVEALEMVRARPFDFEVIITDQTMPRLTGFDLAVEILKIRPQMPVVLCTGYSDQVSAEKAQAAGISQFLMKPLVITEVARAIRAALEKKAQATDLKNHPE